MWDGRVVKEAEEECVDLPRREEDIVVEGEDVRQAFLRRVLEAPPLPAARRFLLEDDAGVAREIIEV
jgi:hypothetical protein